MSRKNITIRHSLADYDGMTLKKIIEKLRKAGVPDDAVFESDRYGDCDEGCHFEFSRLETDKDVRQRKNTEKWYERQEREELKYLKEKYGE